MELKKIGNEIRIIQEDIQETQEKVKRLEHEKNRILNRNKTQERKARTRRMIERGAMLESYLPAEGYEDNHEVKKVLEAAFSTNEVRRLLDAKKESR